MKNHDFTPKIFIFSNFRGGSRRVRPPGSAPAVCYITLQDGKCRFKMADVGATDTGFVDIQKGNETELQMAVATVGPVAVAIDASHISFQQYKSGVYDEPKCSSTRVDHTLLVVGYGIDQCTDYWLAKNRYELKLLAG